MKVRFASKEEGQKLISGNAQYYNRLSKMDIDWRARKEGSTLEELKAFAQSNVLDFTDDDKDIVMQTVSGSDAKSCLIRKRTVGTFCPYSKSVRTVYIQPLLLEISGIGVPYNLTVTTDLITFGIVNRRPIELDAASLQFRHRNRRCCSACWFGNIIRGCY